MGRLSEEFMPHAQVKNEGIAEAIPNPIVVNLDPGNLELTCCIVSQCHDHMFDSLAVGLGNIEKARWLDTHLSNRVLERGTGFVKVEKAATVFRVESDFGMKRHHQLRQ